jgi:hypothetical protein
MLSAVETHLNTQDLLKGARAERVDAWRGKKSMEKGEGLKGARTEPAKTGKQEGDLNR